MQADQTVPQIAEILAELAEVDPTTVTADSHLKDDFDVDSLLMVEITVAVEERFGLTIADEAAAEFHTVGDIASYVGEQAAA